MARALNSCGLTPLAAFSVVSGELLLRVMVLVLVKMWWGVADNVMMISMGIELVNVMLEILALLREQFVKEEEEED